MTSPPARSEVIGAAVESDGTTSSALDGVLTALIGARFFQVAESADQGDTLWLVILTFVFGAVRFWLRARAGEWIRRPDRIDLAAIALVAPHVVSTIFVISTQGQKRAAINMAWEWTASLLIWLELRRVFQAGRGAPLLRTLLAICIALAGYGIWQNQVLFKQTAALVNRYEDLSNRQAQLSLEERQQLQELGQSLGTEFQNATGGTRRLLLDRLRSSTEPMGCFGLANTFASLLITAIGISWALGLRIRGTSRTGQVLSVLVFVILGLCLVMTKSRTAWLGLLCASGLYLFVSQTGKRYRTGVVAALTVVGAGFALGAVALLTGLIDRQVISEAPKSLQYRLQYWSSTSQVILEHPWLGVGPGNFRGHYLHYKLKGASEEILDPHNLMLDVWANGGIVAWAGLLALIIWGIRTGWRAVVYEASQTAAISTPVSWGASLKLAIAVPGLVTAQQLLFGGGIEPRLWGFLVACPFVAGWLTSVTRELRAGALWTAWLALTLHLCGAGGIAMPAVFQLWSVLLAALATAPPDLTQPKPQQLPQMNSAGSPRLLAGLALGCGALAIACLRTGLLPNSLCRAEIQFATETMSTTGQRGVAERQLIAATVNDPLNPEPWALLLSLRGSGDASELRAAIEAGREAIARNPESPLYYEALADTLATVRPATPQTRQQAIEQYRQAAKHYPNSARIRTSLALVLADAEEPAAAAKEAQLALELDDLNRAAGHLDKVLPDDKRARLVEIAARTSAPL